jgi:hypothetical protein
LVKASGLFNLRNGLQIPEFGIRDGASGSESSIGFGREKKV